MAKDEVFAQIEAYCKKYGEQLDKVETGLEYFALHLIAQEKDFTEYLIGGDDPEEVDLSEYRYKQPTAQNILLIWMIKQVVFLIRWRIGLMRM